MKITYPQIHPADIKAGDTILSQWSNTEAINYFEWTVEDTSKLEDGKDVTYYLIDRPKPQLPQEPGTFIIAKKVRGVEFPEGIVLRRSKAKAKEFYDNAVYWMSDVEVPDVGQYGRTRTYDRHPESKIEDWVLAKVVPA